MQIKLNLFLSVILEAVKAETLIKGRIDKATNPQASEVAFNESAGDEALHERKLMRGIYTSLDKLKIVISDFLEEDCGHNVADNVISVVDEKNDTITITVNVNDRFNNSLSDSLARLCSKYIEDNTLFYWWGALGNTQQAQFYQALLVDDTSAIKAIFSKKAPYHATIPYTTTISVVGSEVIMEKGDVETISYTIDDGVKDDIDVKLRGKSVRAFRKNGQLCFEAIFPGVTHARLYSVHDEDVFADIDFVVRSSDGRLPNTEHIKHI